uniref:Uncharacterized protein n=1 Tax=Anguilla anguilla TaxID=7936 RepID=A0A0E9VJ55_ANGAN
MAGYAIKPRYILAGQHPPLPYRNYHRLSALKTFISQHFELISTNRIHKQHHMSTQ